MPGDPSSWLAFVTLATLEVVLGIDNVIFLTMLVGRLPARRQPLARVTGLALAMLTRIALLLSIVRLTGFTRPWFRLGALVVSGRDAVLLAGGLFLLGKSVTEIRRTLHEARTPQRPRVFAHFGLIVAQIALLDVVFSLDSVFTAVGLARPDQLPIMIAAIVAGILAMMFIAARISLFLERYPSLKLLALAFLVVVGAELVGNAFHFDVPHEYLYAAVAFSAVVEALNIYYRAKRADSGDP